MNLLFHLQSHSSHHNMTLHKLHRLRPRVLPTTSSQGAMKGMCHDQGSHNRYLGPRLNQTLSVMQISRGHRVRESQSRARPKFPLLRHRIEINRRHSHLGYLRHTLHKVAGVVEGRPRDHLGYKIYPRYFPGERRISPHL